MKKAASNIDNIIKTLKKETKKLQDPIVTMVADRKAAETPFNVLISCLLSLRTKDEVTKQAFYRLHKLATSPEQMVKLSVKQIEKAIYPVGFYITKSKRIKEICRVLINEYDSVVPDEIDELLKLHGVGRKTANLVVTLGYGKYGICVDVHVHVIANRLGLVDTKTPDQTEMELRKILPKKYWIIFNDLLVMYGQNICTTAYPKCGRCPLEKYCIYKKKDLTRV